MFHRARLRSRPVDQPGPLRRAHHRRGRVERPVARRGQPVAARLIGAVLAGVEDEERAQRSIGKAAIQSRRRPVRRGRPAQRHVLVVRLVGGGAAAQELLDRHVPIRKRRGVVVLDFVIVPGDHPRACGMGGLQRGIEVILRVSAAVLVERDRLGIEMLPRYRVRQIRPARPFVDVIAKMKDEIEILGRQVLVRGEVPELVMLAGSEGKSEAIDGSARRRQRSRASDRARHAAGAEAVPIRPVLLQAGHFDMNRMRRLGTRDRRAAADDLPHAVVSRHLPDDLDRRGRHASIGQRLGREPGPEHGPVGRGIARRHAQRERRRLKVRRSVRASPERTAASPIPPARNERRLNTTRRLSHRPR